MGLLKLTAAEAREIVDRSQRSPSIRAVVDALRRNPDAIPDPIAAVRRAAIAAAAPVSLKQIAATFATVSLPRRVLCEDLSDRLGRLRAADVVRLSFPLREICESRQEGGAKFFDVEAMRQARVERDRAVRRLAEAAVEVESDAAASASDGDELAEIGREFAALGRRLDAIVSRLATTTAPAESADDDPPIEVGWVAKAFGKEADAVAKQAKRRGLEIYVGGRICVLLSALPQLYPKMSGTSRLMSALAACAAWAKQT
jgi:hypothetical protein